MRISSLTTFLQLGGCSGCGQTKKRKTELWSLPPSRTLKVSVDGTAKGKLRPTSISGVFVMARGEVLSVFSLPIALKEYKEAEVLAN